MDAPKWSKVLGWLTPLQFVAGCPDAKEAALWRLPSLCFSFADFSQASPEIRIRTARLPIAASASLGRFLCFGTVLLDRTELTAYGLMLTAYNVKLISTWTHPSGARCLAGLLPCNSLPAVRTQKKPLFGGGPRFVSLLLIPRRLRRKCLMEQPGCRLQRPQA
ncbi:hypothetical protein [Olivibacter sp. XZL3]|uniref:hypothetical protein n=1 Tax=Olivibacter sp. XZL3 TaxID=1735116 RepID=UPI001064CA9D|nr:hypothetical protein [Olivibacter sp. XZL3]